MTSVAIGSTSSDSTFRYRELPENRRGGLFSKFTVKKLLFDKPEKVLYRSSAVFLEVFWSNFVNAWLNFFCGKEFWLVIGVFTEVLLSSEAFLTTIHEFHPFSIFFGFSHLEFFHRQKVGPSVFFVKYLELFLVMEPFLFSVFRVG